MTRLYFIDHNSIYVYECKENYIPIAFLDIKHNNGAYNVSISILFDIFSSPEVSYITSHIPLFRFGFWYKNKLHMIWEYKTGMFCVIFCPFFIITNKWQKICEISVCVSIVNMLNKHKKKSPKVNARLIHHPCWLL